MKLDSSDMVSIHPYFKARPGAMAQIKPVLQSFLARTRMEKDNLLYDFTINGDEIFCREAYRGAAAALAHLENVQEPLGEMLKLADLTRIEIHGPAAELEKLKSPMEKLNPHWFVRFE
jgi:quinol monooxygenase YgiN